MTSATRLQRLGVNLGVNLPIPPVDPKPPVDRSAVVMRPLRSEFWVGAFWWSSRAVVLLRQEAAISVGFRAALSQRFAGCLGTSCKSVALLWLSKPCAMPTLDDTVLFMHWTILWRSGNTR
jgi:hypothetical protein